jgi:hypothetical protein
MVLHLTVLVGLTFPLPLRCAPAHPQVETRSTGQERETGERVEEHMGAQERVVEVAQPRGPCE